jgi:hypothetical protein
LKRRYFIKSIALTAPTIALSLKMIKKDKSLPNFVFFLVDDLGWRDVGCYGSDFYKTPILLGGTK